MAEEKATKKPENTAEYNEFMKSSLKEWKDVADDDLEYHRYGSLSNKVFRVTVKKEGVKPKRVILRHFNDQEDVVDQDKEDKVFKAMSDSGFGPQCYGHNGIYRLEEYFDARDFKAEEYKQKDVRRKLALNLAATHKLKVGDIDQTPMFEGLFKDDKYFEKFNKKCDKEDLYSGKEKEIVKELRTITEPEEREFVKKVLPKDDIVFSHNDLLSGNILMTEKGEDPIFIDYEYASYNFRGFDIGNMFKEATFDYTEEKDPKFRVVKENFPNDEELEDFLRYYLVFTDFDAKALKKEGDKLAKDESAMKEYIKDHYKDGEELEKRIKALKRETMIGAMFSNYYWFMWAVRKHKTSDTDFNYLEFARVSHENYKKLKAELFGNESEKAPVSN